MSYKLAGRVLKLAIKPTAKVILMAYADAAKDDGTAAWPGNDLLATCAQCSERSVQVHRAWLIEQGYLREGNQAHPELLRYPADRRPIAYDVATSEEQRSQWAAQRAASPQGLRDRYAAAGRKGAERTNTDRHRGEDSAPRRPAASHERGEEFCGDGAKLAAPKPTHGTNPGSFASEQPSVDGTPVGVASKADDRAPGPTPTDQGAPNTTLGDARNRRCGSDSAPSGGEQGGDGKVIQFHSPPLRLSRLTDAEKAQRLTAAWISIVRAEKGYEPTREWIRAVGRAIKANVDRGLSNRRLIDMVRANAFAQTDSVEDDWKLPAGA